MQKFICQHCARCCSNIRGSLTEKQKKELQEYSYGKLPIISLIPVEKIAFPLWDFEAKRLIDDAESKGITHKIIPSKAIFDLNSNTTIITSYSIDSDSCTFLKDTLCRSYGLRPFICKMFPFQHGPFLKLDEQAADNMFGTCPSLKDDIADLETHDKRTFSRQLYESFGNSFLSALQADIITGWINDMIITLMKEKKIRPAINYPYGLLLKRIDNSENINFMDFLVKVCQISEQKKENLINQFLNNYHAKQKLEEFR